MSCASCGASLPPDARFCPECGVAAGHACASCGHPLATGHRFCPACGARADTTTVRAGAAGTRPDNAAPSAERRISSVLFGDLVGFTQLAESRDPEEVRDLLSGYFDRCREVVARYGGTIEKFIGDAVMAVWGVPTAHEDDAERAVRAGLDLVEAVADFGERLGADGLAMRVGVVTGEVAVTVGATQQGMVAGDAVNTAARVQAKAEPGAVWADEQTRALTAAAIDYQPAGTHELKGKSEPVVLHRATAVRGLRGGDHREIGVEAPLVGRRRELTLLKEIYQAAVEDRRGRLLVVVGEPGVGKTRLGWELQKYTDGLSAVVWWHWGRCHAYGDGVAYSALSAPLRRRIGVDDGAPADDQRARLREHLATIAADAEERSWLEPRLAVLLGGEDSYAREELFAAWVAWFQRISHGGDPVVWVIDDARYADEGLLDFVEHLAATARFPLLVVMLARQELLDRRPRLAVSRRGTVIGLEGLADEQMGQLLDSLVVDLPPRVRAELIEGAEGLPLYAVETVRALMDRGLVMDDGGQRRLAAGVDAATLTDIGAPTSLQMLIASRLDALPRHLHELVQFASVLGTSFTLEGLAAVSGRPPEKVAEGVEELAVRDLVTQVSDRFSPDFGRYAFVQAMVRQVAYRTQSRPARLARHLAAAGYLGTQAEMSGELVSIVAQHLSDALSLMPGGDPRVPGLTDDLVRWLERSGQRARSLGLPEDAMHFYSQALEHVGQDGGSRARIAVQAAQAANDAGHSEHAIALASDVRDDDPVDLQARAATVRGDAQRRLGRPDEAQKEFAPFLERTSELPDGTASTLLRLAARASAEVGDVPGGRPLVEEALRRAEQSGDAVLIGWALNDLSALYYFAELPRVATVILDGAITFCESSHAATPLMAVLLNRGMGSVTHDLREALRFYERALRQSRQAADSLGVWITTTALLMTRTIAGRWADDAGDDENAPLYEPILEESPIMQALFDALLTLRAWVRGERPEEGLPRVDEPMLQDARRDMGQEVSLVRLVHARLTGRLAELVPELARKAAVARHEYGGTVEWYPFLWSTAVQWLLEAGAPADLTAARDAIAVVEEATGRREPAVAAQLPRLRATLALLDPGAGADPAAVERDLWEAILALENYGAVPDRARAQQVLGRWLAARGEVVEAARLIDAAAAAFDELGMTAELPGLDAVLSRLEQTA